MIAKEMGVPQPCTTEDFESLLAQVKEIECCINKGPLVKLMRWFSCFQSARWYEGQLFVLKMVLEAYLTENMGVAEEDLMCPGAPMPSEAVAERENPADQSAQAARHELSDLRLSLIHI